MPSLGETVGALARLSKAAKRVHSGSRPVRLAETLSFGPNPGALRMLHYLPPGLEAGAPLVVVLHGCTQTAEGYAEGAGWLALADRYGFAVLAPEQRQSNNANLCFNWFEPGDIARGKGEAASIRQMIAHITDAHALDAARVFVTGLSAGGAMTNVMLAAYPEVFTAGAIIAGLPYRAAEDVQQAFGAMFQPAARSASAWGDLVRAASSHTGPWPRVSVWHGDADGTVKAPNGEAIAAQWANVHGLSGATTADILGHKRQTWAANGGESLVEHYAIAGLAHGTPLACGGEEGCGAAGPFLIEAGISSSLEIARFWKIAPEGAARPVSTSIPPEPPPARHHGVDIQAIINKALTSAGLMR